MLSDRTLRAWRHVVTAVVGLLWLVLAAAPLARPAVWRSLRADSAELSAPKGRPRLLRRARRTGRGVRGDAAEPTTVETAISRVVTGDAIVLRGGTYRTGGLTLNQGITLQPYADERPVLKGTLVATKWETLRNNVWRTQWTHLFPAAPLGWWRREREGMLTPLHRFNNDMVFLDGELLQSAGWEGELDAHSFYIDYKSGYVYIGVGSGEPPRRDHGLRRRAPAHDAASPRQDVGPQGPGDPWPDVHAVRLSGDRHRRQEPRGLR